MKPWVRLGTAVGPRGQPLTLEERDGELVIRTAGQLLMSSARHGSEESLAAAGLEGLGGTAATVLIGGLGLGYTLRAALDRLGPAASVVVAELSQAVLDWSPMFAHLTRGAVSDPRVTVEVVEVGELLNRSVRRFDAVLLDVDNGPAALSHPGNKHLYSPSGLGRLHHALKPGGVLVVWSAGPDPAFLERLGRAGFTARAKEVPVREGSRAKHTLFVARRKDRPVTSGQPNASPGRRERTAPAASGRPPGRRGRGGRAR